MAGNRAMGIDIRREVPGYAAANADQDSLGKWSAFNTVCLISTSPHRLAITSSGSGPPRPSAVALAALVNIPAVGILGSWLVPVITPWDSKGSVENVLA
jgi:hypothetical protein